VPVIACGGAGNPKDIAKCIARTGCDAISMASILHYNKDTVQDIKKELESQNMPLCNNKSITANIENPPVKKNISIIDYGVGNIMSVISAFKKIGCTVKVISTAKEVADAESLVLPGVGAFGEGMKRLEEKGLDMAIKKHVASGKPLLGICLGAQLLLSKSEEFGHHKGLDIIKGEVTGFKHPKEVNLPGYKVPHIMWNELHATSATMWNAGIFSGIKSPFNAYFIHSFYLAPEDKSLVLATSTYGNQVFCAAFRNGNLYGCQFHPEKSGEAGLQIIRNFAKL
jgi:glutamine amidotransferase